MNIITLSKNTLLNLFHTVLRGTGRTTHVVDSAQNGSLIIVLTLREVREVQEMAKRQGKTVVVKAEESGLLSSVADKINGQKFTSVHFDHRFIEKMIIDQLNGCDSSLKRFSEYFTGDDSEKFKARIHPENLQ